MKLLLTGGTGLIGRHFLERMAPQHELVCIARSEPPQDLAASAEWIRWDLAEPLEPGRLPDRVDGVVHLAQSERYRDFPDGAEDIFAVNVRSTADLLEYGRKAGARAFVLAATGGCYAPSPDVINEDSPLSAAGPYFRSKRMAELLAENYAEMLGGAILRLFFVYGPVPGARLITRLATQIVEDEEVVVEGDPGMRMNPIFAEDVAAAIEAALGLERQTVINVAGAEVVTVTDLVERLASALGRRAAIRHTGEMTGDLVADTTRMKDRLVVAPATSLDEGLAAVARSIGATPEVRAARGE